jgi:aspartate aminotransferase-like enzyme
MLHKTRLLTPGPTQLPERVRLAMAREMVHHRKPPFKKLLRTVRENLQTLFGTTQPVIALTASGSGAMTAAVSNLFAAGETVIVIEVTRVPKPSAAYSSSVVPVTAPYIRGIK